MSLKDGGPTVVSLAAFKKAKQEGGTLGSLLQQEEIHLFPTFAAVSLMQYFEYTDTFPEAVREMDRAIRGALMGQGRSILFVPLSTYAMECIQTVSYSDVVSRMKDIASEEMLRHANST